LFNTAKKFISETNLQFFNDIEVFLEISDILEKIKSVIEDEISNNDNISYEELNNKRNEALESALQWVNVYKTKLQSNGSKLEFYIRIL
jgi:abortive infection bacteriophage resistance protein